MAKRSKQLVIQHLENISRKALEKYQPIIREYIKGQQGVYALYRGDRLKYVGLASNLRNRLRTHFRDRHAQSWDKFSVYLTVDDEHLRELEALVIRIAAPKENRQKGKFAKSENLLRRFRGDITRFQRKELNEITGMDIKETKRKPRRAKTKKKSRKAHKKEREPVLAPFVTERFKIKAKYKGERHIARVRANGLINIDGKLYTSPSAAGKSITKRATDGWRFWKYRNDKGEWVQLKELRKK